MDSSERGKQNLQIIISSACFEYINQWYMLPIRLQKIHLPLTVNCPWALVRPLVLTAEHSYMPASSCEMLEMYKLPTGEILQEKEGNHISTTLHMVCSFSYTRKKSVKIIHIYVGCSESKKVCVGKVKNVCAYNLRRCFIVPDQLFGMFSRV